MPSENTENQTKKQVTAPEAARIAFLLFLGMLWRYVMGGIFIFPLVTFIIVSTLLCQWLSDHGWLFGYDPGVVALLLSFIGFGFTIYVMIRRPKQPPFHHWSRLAENIPTYRQIADRIEKRQ